MAIIENGKIFNSGDETMKTILTSAVIAAGLTGAAAAAPVNIDNFDTTVFQVVGAPTLGNSPVNPATTSGPTADAIGGTRTITNERTDPAGTANAFGAQVTTVVSDGDAKVGLGFETSGTSLISYSTTGVDLVDGTNDAILVDVLSFNLAGIFLTFGIDGIEVTKAASVGTVEFDFSEFAGADLTNAGDLSLLLSGPESFDITFDNIRAGVGTPAPNAVPLPAAGFLIIGGLGALGALRARRKI